MLKLIPEPSFLSNAKLRLIFERSPSDLIKIPHFFPQMRLREDLRRSKQEEYIPLLVVYHVYYMPYLLFREKLEIIALI